MTRKYRVWSLLEKRAAVDRMACAKHGELAAEVGISKRNPNSRPQKQITANGTQGLLPLSHSRGSPQRWGAALFRFGDGRRCPVGVRAPGVKSWVGGGLGGPRLKPWVT